MSKKAYKEAFITTNKAFKAMIAMQELYIYIYIFFLSKKICCHEKGLLGSFNESDPRPFQSLSCDDRGRVVCPLDVTF